MPTERWERQIRGIPLWLLEEYLQDLGGKKIEDGIVRGDGWQANLEKAENFKIGSLSIGQVQMVLEADEGRLEKLLPELHKKMLRAGA